VGNENQLINSINTLECYLDQLKVSGLLTFSRVSGMQTSKSFRLDDCRSLDVYGPQAVIRYCEKLQLDFGVEVTGCGPQPRSGNHTISRDGITVVPIQSCYWQTAASDIGHLIRHSICQGSCFRLRSRRIVRCRSICFRNWLGRWKRTTLRVSGLWFSLYLVQHSSYLTC